MSNCESTHGESPTERNKCKFIRNPRRITEKAKSFQFLSLDDESDFKCYSCCSEFNLKDDWQIHMNNYFNYSGCFPKQEVIFFKDIGNKIVINGINIYVCNSCGYNHSNKPNVIDHYSSNHKKLELPCGFCPDKYFSRVQYLKRHINVSHNPTDQYYYCNDCDYQSKLKHYLRCHIFSVHLKRLFTCALCLFKSTRSGLRHHMFLNHSTREKILKCHLCNYSTDLSQYLGSHLKLSHSNPDDAFKCNKCSYSAKNMKNLKQHFMRKHTMAQYKCTKCSFIANTDQSLRNHKKLEHSNHLLSFNCTLCEFNTNRKDLYFIHMNIKHLNQLELQCGECKLVCKSNETFKIHVYTAHDPFRVYLYCALCPYKAVRKHSIVNHIETLHSAPKLYRCQSCKYTTNAKLNLAKHKLNIHKSTDAKYICHYCSFQCRVKQYLKCHFRRKHKLPV